MRILWEYKWEEEYIHCETQNCDFRKKLTQILHAHLDMFALH